jgi:hypothetical protein
MNTTEHTWLDLVPPRGMVPGEAQPPTESGDAITVTQHELKQINRLMVMASDAPERADDLRQALCRGLGPERVAVILQNSERGLGTPVTVES